MFMLHAHMQLFYIWVFLSSALVGPILAAPLEALLLRSPTGA